MKKFALVAALVLALAQSHSARSDPLDDALADAIEASLPNPDIPAEIAVAVETAIPSNWRNTSGAFEITELALDRSQGRFTAIAQLAGAAELEALPIAGRAVAQGELPVLSTGARRGELIDDSAIEYRKFSVLNLPKDVVADVADLAGKAARRTLRPGVPIRAADLMAPIVIARNAIVAMTYHSAGIRVTARGRALANGGIGETIRVLNVDSKRTIEAIVVDSTNVIAIQGLP